MATKKISEALPPTEPVFQGAERMDREELLGEEHDLLDGKIFVSTIQHDGKTQKDYAVVLADYEGKNISYIAPGVCAKKIKTLLEGKLFPVTAKLIKRKSGQTGMFYWDYE